MEFVNRDFSEMGSGNSLNPDVGYICVQESCLGMTYDVCRGN